MPGEGTAGHGVATAPQLLGGDMPKIAPPRLDGGGGGGTIRFPTEFSGASGSGGKVARGHEGTRPTDFGLAALAATVSGESGGVLDLDLVGEEEVERRRLVLLRLLRPLVLLRLRLRLRPQRLLLRLRL